MFTKVILKTSNIRQKLQPTALKSWKNKCRWEIAYVDIWLLTCNTKDIILLLHVLGREKSRDISEGLISRTAS